MFPPNKVANERVEQVTMSVYVCLVSRFVSNNCLT